MQITKKELISLNACKDGLERFVKQTGNTDKPVDVVSLVGGLNTYSDLLWLAGKKLTKKEIVKFACDCALLNIEKIKPYTDEHDLIVGFLNAADAAAIAASVASAAHAASTVRAAIAASVASAAVDSKEEVNNLLRDLFNRKFKR